MKSRIPSSFFLVAAAVILCAGANLRAAAQPRSDSLRRAYDFKGAVAWCEWQLARADSSRRDALEAELILSQNGLSMTQYCSQPVVVARRRCSLDDFFLYYPMEDRAWRSVPNPLDSLAGRGEPVRALFAPAGAKELYFSARDADGIRNLCHTAFRDSVWSLPSLLNEALTSSSDEIYPVVSRDGKALYFASRGLYGMGGYDLYVARWNEGARDWDAPVNLGFPYSSPYNDFLFVNSDDGQYSLFASDRACPGSDSVDVYVLAFDSMPIRKEIRTVDGLKSLCALTPPETTDRENDTPAEQTSPEDEHVRQYRAALDHVQQVRDSIARHNARLERLRDELKTAGAERQAALREDILSGEIALPARQKQLKAALAEVQRIETECLARGIRLNPDALRASDDRAQVPASTAFTFVRNTMGPALRIAVEKPVPTFDYSFKILPVGQFAEDNTLPGGLLYQIQLFSSSRKVSEKELKGLSPVFERRGASGLRIYSVGIFRSYADVLGCLNKVKKAGFRNAMIVAFEDGKPLSVPQAREKEAQVRTLFNVRIHPEDGQTLPEKALDAIHALTDKDITRSAEGAGFIFEVGPFSEREDCEVLLSALRQCGVGNVSVVEAKGAEAR